MTGRFLFVPSLMASPRGAETIPASAYAIEQLRSYFDVDVFAWPHVHGGADVPPTWQGAVGALREAFSPGVHVLSMETSTPIAVMALAGDSDSDAGGRTSRATRVELARSFATAGISFSPATLRSLGMGAMAQAASAGSLFNRSYQWVRHVMQGANEDEWTRYAQALDADINWQYFAEFRASYDSLDLVAEKPLVNIPTLYLDKPPGKSVFGAEIRQRVFKTFVPDAETRELREEWGNRLQDARTGRDFADPVISFIQRLGPETILATVMFTDIVDSTVRAAELGDRRWSQLLAEHHTSVRRVLARFGGHEVDTAGDGFLATFDSPARAVHCAAAIRDAVDGLGLTLRIGLHTGECEILGEKVGGMAVHIAARVAAAAGPGQVLVSSTLRELVAGSGLPFDDLGSRELRGVPGEWRLFSVERLADVAR
jgi:class 3 adenylate cyclase